MKKILPLVVSLLLFSSCWKDVWVDLEETPHMLTVATYQLRADSVIRLGIQPAEYDYRTNWDSLRQITQVRLWVNGQDYGIMPAEYWPIDATTYTPCPYYFISDYKPQEGDCIRIEAACEGYETISAETQIPAVVPIEKLDYTCVTDTTTGYIKLDFRLTFSDRPETADYYAYNIIPFMKDSLGLPMYTGYGYGYYGTNTIEEADPIVKFRPNTLDYLFQSEEERYVNFFDDSEISGETYTLQYSYSTRFSYYAGMGDRYEERHKLPDTLYIETNLTSMSQDNYNSYIASWAAQGFLIQGMVETGLADPIEEYSNVNNGLGVLGSSNICTQIITLFPKQYHQNSTPDKLK